jgi:hypothetical protein
MKKKNKYLFIDVILFILDLILDLIIILIFFIGPHIRNYLIFFFMLKILIFFFNNSLYFGFILSYSDLDFYFSYLYHLINNIRDIIDLDFCFVMLILYSIFAKDVTLFNYLFWFFYIYIFLR